MTEAEKDKKIERLENEVRMLKRQPGAYNLFCIDRHDLENLMKYMECTDLACGNPHEYEFVCTVNCKNSTDTLTFPIKFRE